jgi:hypothetical protein
MLMSIYISLSFCVLMDAHLVPFLTFNCSILTIGGEPVGTGKTVQSPDTFEHMPLSPFSKASSVLHKTSGSTFILASFLVLLSLDVGTESVRQKRMKPASSGGHFQLRAVS